MEVARHLALLRETGERLGRAAASCRLDTPVPSCEGWQLRELLGHVGGVHRWACSHILTARRQPTTSEEEALFFAAPGDSELLDWYAEGHRQLVAAIAAAPPDLDCWTFLPAPSPLCFWARRQAHETAIHCADAERAAGITAVFPADFALDGLDELLSGFYGRPGSRLRAEQAVSIELCPQELEESITVEIGPDGPLVSRRAGPADCSLSGPASDLYLFCWNRLEPSDLSVEGDRAVLELWRERAKVVWG